jgi:hypothetical protein
MKNDHQHTRRIAMTYKRRKRTQHDGLGPIIDGDYLDAGDFMFMDGNSDEFEKGAAMARAAMNDGRGHRPGFAYGDEASRETAHTAYQERSKHLENAWRKDGKTTDHVRPTNLKDAQDAAALAYEERNERLRNGWKEKTA